MANIDENLRRVPPQSLEAEESVLGAVMLDNTVVDRVVEMLRPEDFYRGAHRKLFRAMVELNGRSEPIDLITLSETLKARGDLAEVGGGAYLAELTERVPTAANAVHYAKIVRERSILRGLIEASTEIAMRGYQARDNVDELLDHAEQLIFGIQERKVKQAFAKLSEVLVESIKTIERLYEQKQAVTGVPTGFADLDALTAGLQPSDLIIVAGRPSMGKCLTADAEIVLADGSVRTIEEIVAARSARLLTLTDRWRLTLAEPSAFVDDGHKPVFEVTTRLGRKIRTTLPHPFLTVDGWKPLSELQPGDRVAVPRRIDIFGEGSLGESRVKVLAYLLGDGTLTGPCPRFTNGDPRLRAEFREAVCDLGELAVREDVSAARTTTVRVSSDRMEVARCRRRFGATVQRQLAARCLPARQLAAQLGVTPASVTNWCQGRTVPARPVFQGLCVALDLSAEEVAPAGLSSLRGSEGNALARWLASLGLHGKTARAKFIPDVVFTLRREELACFLNRVFATDGWATVLTSGQAQLGFCSASERMAHQVQHLLLRFGVIASLRRRLVEYGGGRRPAFQLDITDAESIRIFSEEIGIFGKEAALAKVNTALARERYQTNRDLIPAAVWRQIDAARQGAPWRSIGGRMGLTDSSNLHVGRRALSRRRLAAFARAHRPSLRPRVPEAGHGGRAARRRAHLHRRHAGALGPRAARQGAAAEARCRCEARARDRRLHPAHAVERGQGQPRAGDIRDIPLAQGARQRARRPGAGALAAEPPGREPYAARAAARGSSRIRRDRAGRARHLLPLPRRVLQPRGHREAGRRRGPHRQAAERPRRQDRADLPEGVHALREPRGGARARDGRRHGLGVALAALTRDGGAGRREHPLRFDSAPLNRVLRSAAACGAS